MTDSEENDFTVGRSSGLVSGVNPWVIEEQRKAREAGFAQGEYTLVIREVVDIERTLDALLTLGMMYAEPEESYGVVWRIPKPHTRQVLAAQLQDLPLVFGKYNEIFAYHAERALREAGCAVYSIERVGKE